MISRLMHIITWLVFTPTIKIFTKFRVIGKENLKKVKGPVIFVSNHESYFDPWIIGAGIPLSCFNLYPVYYLTQDRLFKKFFLKTAIKLYGAFSGRIGEGAEKALEKPLRLLNKNKTIGVFPEWCYVDEPNLSRIQKVIALASLKSMRLIIPIFIYGIYDGGISWRKILFGHRDVKIIFGEPIYPQKKVTEEQMVKLIQQSLLQTRLTLIKIFHEEEKRFWNNYAQFYHYLERAKPYKDLINNFSKELPDIIKGKWVDLGSGSGAIIESLLQKAGNPNLDIEIIATDFDPTMIDYLSKRFQDNKNIKIKNLDLAFSFDFPDNSLDGITANLVLSYIIHHEGEIGIKAFKKIFQEIFRILKPGGDLIWSSPKNNVHFERVFFASWRNIFDPNNLNHIYYGPAILKQALQIQHKGICDIYHFLKIKDLEKLLADIGFKNIKFSRSMTNQVDIINCRKP